MQNCYECLNRIEFSEFCIHVSPEHKTSEEQLETESSILPAWHVSCFRCNTCSDLLVDNFYAWYNNRPYCIRHYGQKIRPRCASCDQVTKNCLL